MWPKTENISAWTDAYFNRSKEIVERFGDKSVTYAVFMRRPVTSAPRLMIEWLEAVAAQRQTAFQIEIMQEEGKWVGAGEPIVYITGPMSHLVDLETLFLQKLGACCVAAYNAYNMCVDLPKTAFLAFDARHCAGTEMAEMMAYAASVGSEKAKRKVGARGFVGNATDATARFFGNDRGMGTMPHAIIGYAGSTVRSAEMFHEAFPDRDLVVLVDYFGQEVSDSLEVCRRFPELADAGRISVRVDTPGGRYVEGLDPPGSYAVLERHSPDAVRGYRDETELRYLIGAGVSAAAICTCAKIWTRPASTRSRSSLLPASTRRNARSWPPPKPPSTLSAPARSCPSAGRIPMRRRISSPMTASRWSRSGANSCCTSPRA